MFAENTFCPFHRTVVVLSAMVVAGAAGGGGHTPQRAGF